jgi:CheY-like chemotaxis protein
VIILAIEDDLDDVDFFCEAVKVIDPKIQCIFARDGVEALSILDNTIPDLIFLDLNMPIMDGETCLMEIKKKEYLKEIPVVIYSTAPEVIINPDNLKKDSVDILKKEVSFTNTVDSIKRVLEKYKKQ